MRIAIDARWIFPKISGIGNYTRQLLHQFARLERPGSLLVLFNDAAVMKRTLDETGLAETGDVAVTCLPWGVFSLQSQLRLPAYLKREHVDVFHSPNYMIPLAAFPRGRTGRVKCVTTIHDVIPMLFPDHAPKSRKTRLFPIFRALMQEVGKRADAIITVSDASRRDILQQLRIPPNAAGKVHTVYNGVSEHYTPATALPETAAEAPTLLYVGRADPYKNVDTLIRALAHVRTQTCLPVRLVIAGSPDPRYPQATELAESLNLSDAVTWTGYLTDEALVETYRTADLLVHPSRYEGFGLQIIEAMACGTPVVSSNAGSLPEVAGDAGLLVDPDDTEGFAEAITRVLTEPGLAVTMREKGLQQATAFTWEAAARKTLAVYETVAGDNPDKI